jgi:prepilin-type N-terminal cleavage/methylation domain-containing protein
MRSLQARKGFTLVEILIVISIIALLASMILAGVSYARRRAYEALAKTLVTNLSSAMETYYRDSGEYPGNNRSRFREGDNAFPALFEALFGQRPPRGKGGPSSPYMELKESDVVVWDNDEEKYRPAEPDEIRDPKMEKWITDPWGIPLVYRENKSRTPKRYMHNAQKADIYSTGPDRTDQTIEEEKGDDIGNW